MSEALTAAGRNMLKRLAFDPVTREEDFDRLCNAIQNLINARAISGWGVEGGWRWQIHDAGWEALVVSFEQRARREAEDRAFNLERRQAMEWDWR